MTFDEINKYYTNYNSLRELLEDKYDFILTEIVNEEYIISYDDFEIFQPIIYEGRVAGFYTYERYKDTSDKFLVTELYVMPEFRGNGIASELVWKWHCDPNYVYYIQKPSRAFIDLLIKNNLAKKFNNLVLSVVRFSVDIEEFYINSKIGKSFKTLAGKEGMSFIATLYDYNLCSTVIVEASGYYSRIRNMLCISTSRDYDMLKYNLKAKFRKVSMNYLKNLSNTYLHNKKEVDKFKDDCQELSDKKTSIEYIIGSEGNFNDTFLSRIRENNLDMDDALRIYRHICDRLAADELTQKSINLRIDYLIKNMDKTDRISDEVIIFAECPFCYEKINEDLTVCDNCGYKISDEKEVIHSAEPPLLTALKSYRKFVKKHSIDEMDNEYDLKSFYRKYLISEYNFHEFRDFYYQREGEAIEKICDEFLEYKLNEELKFNPYEAYKNFLITNTYFKLDYDLKECMIYLIKFTILVSNDYNYNYADKNANIIENSRSSIDIFYFISERLPEKIDLDIDECCEIAFERFRLDEYKNNREEICEEFPKYFENGLNQKF